MLADTIANYYRYNRKWYQEEEFLGVAVSRKRKYKRFDSLNEKEKAKIQTLYSQGVSIKRIGVEFDLSESAISRLFGRQSKRRAYVKDSRMIGLFSSCK